MLFEQIITKTTSNPRMLFLIDGLGALLSAFLLGVILTRFENTFGMPRNVLYFLSFLPSVFAAYDFICYFRISGNIGFYLKIIAFANLTYCTISICLVFHHYQKLTILGLIYFLVEIAIIIFLASIELKTISKLAEIDRKI